MLSFVCVPVAWSFRLDVLSGLTFRLAREGTLASLYFYKLWNFSSIPLLSEDRADMLSEPRLGLRSRSKTADLEMAVAFLGRSCSGSVMNG